MIEEGDQEVETTRGRIMIETDHTREKKGNEVNPEI
jgi:hypothetical protein